MAGRWWRDATFEDKKGRREAEQRRTRTTRRQAAGKNKREGSSTLVNHFRISFDHLCREGPSSCSWEERRAKGTLEGQQQLEP